MMETILYAWLRNFCETVPGSTRAVIVTDPPGVESEKLTLYWPNEVSTCGALERLAKSALIQQQTVLQFHSNVVEATGEPLDALACPVIMEGGQFGAVALELPHRSQQVLQTTAHHLQDQTRWLETLIRLSDSSAREKLVQLVQLVAIGQEHGRFKAAATEIANELADRFACRRVSMGFMRANRIRIEALSHCSRIDPRSNIVRAIQDAMAESLDQGAEVIYPLKDPNSVQFTQFHRRLAEVQHGAAICTLPLVKNDKAVGALLLEREAEKPFNSETVAQCEQIGLLLGPVLETRRREERPIFLKIIEALRNGFSLLIGPGHLPLKTGAVLMGLLLLWLSLASGTFRVSCDSVIEAGVSRVIAAPQKGFIAEAGARAGDLVHKGDRLATLDDQDLQLELRKWQSQLAQVQKEYRQALARFDRAEIAILRAKRDQAEAQLHLVEQEIERTRLVAPFDGVVIKGDLSLSLGSPVTPGQVLFELAPSGQYRIVLKIDERDIDLVTTGQQGQLKLSGIPDLTVAARIDRLTPVSTVEAGRNCFRAEAIMNQPSDLIRPGMVGITKIEIGQRRLIWIWTRRMVDELKLFLWKHLSWWG